MLLFLQQQWNTAINVAKSILKTLPKLYMCLINRMIDILVTLCGNNFIIVFNHTIMKIIWCIKGIETSYRENIQNR